MTKKGMAVFSITFQRYGRRLVVRRRIKVTHQICSGMSISGNGHASNEDSSRAHAGYEGSKSMVERNSLLRSAEQPNNIYITDQTRPNGSENVADVNRVKRTIKFDELEQSQKMPFYRKWVD